MHMLQHEHVMWESKYVCFVCEFEYVFFCARVSVYACVCTYIYSKHFILTSPQAAKGCSVCLCVCVCVCVCVCLFVLCGVCVCVCSSETLLSHVEQLLRAVILKISVCDAVLDNNPPGTTQSLSLILAVLQCYAKLLY